MSRIYTLCGTCGRDVTPTPNVDRLCRDCWECAQPLDPRKLRQVQAEEREEARREARRRWLDAHRDEHNEYRRKWSRGRRAERALAAAQSPEYHTAYLERFDVTRAHLEAAS